ncbi:MAG: TIR domain-containing protein [Lachnospiraceae bacterium]|nr:TIR domain-containing protein [Lachnospiraceae bacterium]
MTGQGSVFISYSSKNRGFVNRITSTLEHMGVKYWKAPEMIPAGSSYAREIPQAIQNCAIFLLVLSKTSQNSIWVEKEIDSAICNRKVIIPFQIEEMELNDTFRFYLNNVQMISYPDNEDGAFQELKRQLSQLMPPPEKGPEADSLRDGDGAPQMVAKGEPHAQAGDPHNRILSIETRDNPAEKNRGKSNALRMNRIPLACQYCGCKELRNVSMGTFRCVRCGRDNFDDYQTVRNYLERVGASSAQEIERDTGVPRRIIEYFFRDEYLEIPLNSQVRVPCERCGAPIRTGTLCDKCKEEAKKAAGAKSSSGAYRGSWHFQV